MGFLLEQIVEKYGWYSKMFHLNKFEVRKIERDYFSNDWYFSDCDEMVEFISDSFIPIMWTDSFNNTILKTLLRSK